MDNLLFIDIETIPGETMPDIEEVKLKAPKTMSKSETIDKWAAENQIEIYKKQALDSMQGRGMLFPVFISILFLFDNVCKCRIRDLVVFSQCRILDLVVFSPCRSLALVVFSPCRIR